MPGIPSAQLHHLALTVIDVDASVTWYEECGPARPTNR